MSLDIDRPLLLTDDDDDEDYTEQPYVMNNHPIKHKESHIISNQVEAFLSAGGKIDCVSADIRTSKTEALKVRSDAARAAMLVIDKRKLKSMHKEGIALQIKYVKKTRTHEEGFRVSANGINLGVRPLLDDALLIKTTP